MNRTSALLVLLGIAGTADAQASREEAESFFEAKVRPVLVETCSRCHGVKKVSSGLRVDSREALLKGGERGPAIITGEPDKSLLVQAIRQTHADVKMPPDNKLPDRVIADITSWIKNGAVWPASGLPFRSANSTHWAFQPVRPVPPPLDPTGWSAHPIDRFIAVKLQAHGLKPVGLADKRTLLRRVTFDLIGLPPSPEEMSAFLADDSPDAYPRVVERLLASPHYGERWGRHWMDVVRYADTAGDNADYPIPEIHLYRDYIINSFNADKPYDQFVQEQLAGDMLAKEGPREKHADQVIATGFLALSRRYATAPYELWHLTLEDAIETTGRAFLGLTLRCARCHDHKFDPVTKEDYYALYGIFASTQFPWAGGEEFASMQKPRQHFVPLAPEEAAPRLAVQQQRLQRLEAELQRTEKESDLVKRLAELSRQIDARTRQLTEKREWTPSPYDLLAIVPGNLHSAPLSGPQCSYLVDRANLIGLQKQRDAANNQLQGQLNGLRNERWSLRKPGLPPELPGAYAVQEGSAVDAHIHIRGDVDQRGPTVKRNVPRFLTGDKPLTIPEASSGRLQLAEWLTRPEHPLTARVLVNRLWQHHFGKGLVTTPSNFGIRGEPPSHPELLDYLASRLIEGGWSIKTLHRQILLSKTYQLSSTEDETNAAQDPSNRWYWRHDRRRLEAEAIRDALLAVSGKLDGRRPGPHPFPPIDKWSWTQHTPFKDVYPSSYRSVYLMTQRFQRNPYLAIFDGPDTNTSVEQRPSSTVPLQALYLMNNPFMLEQAEGFARRMLVATADPRQRIELAHELAWCRPARPEEGERASRYLQEYRQPLLEAGTPTERLELEAWTSYARVLLSANEFVYID